MARNETAMKRGWNYDKPNAQLKAMVDGKEAFLLDAMEKGAFLRLGNQPGEALASIIDGYGVDLSTDYSATKYSFGTSYRLYGIEVNADTGSTDMTGDVNAGAIKGRVVIGTTQTNCGFSGIVGTCDVGTVNIVTGGTNGLCGVLDIYGTCSIGASSHASAVTAVIWNELATTVGATATLAGVDIVQNTAPQVITSGGLNPAILIRGSTWQWGIYAASGALTNGISMTCATLNATTGRLGAFIGSMAASNLGDGYGAFEVDLTITGTLAGNVAASSSWVNIPSGTLSGSYVCARSDGIYEASGATATSAMLIFGARMSAIIGDTSEWNRVCPFSISSSGTITALFSVDTLATNLGFTAGAHSSPVTGSVPFLIDSNNNKKYIRLYDTAA